MKPTARCAPRRRPPATFPPIRANSSAIQIAINHQAAPDHEQQPNANDNEALEGVQLPVAEPDRLPQQEESEVGKQKGSRPPFVDAERKGRVQREQHQPQEKRRAAACER